MEEASRDPAYGLAILSGILLTVVLFQLGSTVFSRKFHSKPQDKKVPMAILFSVYVVFYAFVESAIIKYLIVNF